MKSIRRWGITIVFTGVAQFFGCFAGIPAAQAALPTTSGIWRSREPGRELSAEHEWLLVRSLRRITGLDHLHFTAEGSLSLGETAAPGGALVARQILLSALHSGMVFVIEDHSQSASVNFGQLDEGLTYVGAEGQSAITIWRVRLDFDDFRKMQASPEVRAAFDEGFTLLHELLHGLGLKDTSREAETGQCEELLNRARAELGLPLRDQYLGEPWQPVPAVTLVRLRFKSREWPSSRSRWRWRYLYFVLGLGPPGQWAASPASSHSAASRSREAPGLTDANY